MADPNDAAETLNSRSRSYLAANCAHCHQPGGPAPGGMDMRYEPLLGGMSLIGVTPTQGDLGITGAQRIKPGASAQTVEPRTASRYAHGTHAAAHADSFTSSQQRLLRPAASSTYGGVVSQRS